MNMPVMNGIQFLSKVRAVAPDTVRMMFTGTGQSTAVEAINKGEILRYLTKPCTTEVSMRPWRPVWPSTVKPSPSGICYPARSSEQSSSSPRSWPRPGRSPLDAPSVFGCWSGGSPRKAAPTLMWRAELAALLSQIGCIGLSEEVLTKAYAGKQIVARDAELFREHPQVGRNLLKTVPRLEAVADIVLQQEKHFDGGGFPADNVAGEEIPIEARILKVALDLDSLTFAGAKLPDAIAEMNTRAGRYDQAVLEIATQLTKGDDTQGLSA